MTCVLGVREFFLSIEEGFCSIVIGQVCLPGCLPLLAGGLVGFRPIVIGNSVSTVGCLVILTVVVAHSASVGGIATICLASGV